MGKRCSVPPFVLPPEQTQRWSATDYAANARFVADLGSPLLELLAPKPGEQILDLVCGDGALTELVATSGAVVVGVDGSAEMVAAARARGVDAYVADGQRLAFDNAFDAVFSNAALHWMPEAEAVVAGVARALRPGGRFVAEMGGHMNVAAIATAIRAVLASRGRRPSFAWFFPTAERYGSVLAAYGFTIVSMTLFARPTLLPTGMKGFLTTFAAPFLRDVPPGELPSILADIEAALEPSLRDDAGRWTGDYVRLRFHATRDDIKPKE